MKNIRANKEKTAIAMLLVFVFQLIPSNVFALTGGPTQPEVQGFQPIGVTDMVDLFSGDFKYNLPLLDVDGYPINLSYSGNVSSDAEASWVGLGWDLNTGAVTRSMRGVPDEFQGETVRKVQNLRPNKQFSLNVNPNLEMFGFEDFQVEDLKASLSLEYSNYNGFKLSSNVSKSNLFTSRVSKKIVGETSLSLSSSDQGLGISPNMSFSKVGFKDDGSLGFKDVGSGGISFNSRAGLQGLSYKTKMMGKQVELGDGINLGLDSYTPQIQTAMVNSSISYNIKLGDEVVGMYKNSSASGTYTWQNIKQEVTDIPAYGYLNTEKAGDYALLDVNREKDGSFSKNTPMLPLTNYTYDMFNVNAQGVGGTFRPYRSEVGYLYDNKTENTNIGIQTGTEHGILNTFKVGVNIGVNYGFNRTGPWTDHYNKFGYEHFTNKVDLNSVSKDFEVYAYKQLGELTADEESFVPSVYGGSDPYRFNLKNADITHSTTPSLIDKYGNSKPFPSDNHREARIKRNTLLSILSREEVERFGLENNLSVMYNAPGHHPAELTVLKDDGARYVFGIAAYNIKQEETNFNVGRRKLNVNQSSGIEGDIDRKNGLVYYDYQDNSTANDRGVDNQYSNTITPAYAHSFLLTAILSTDYVDIDGIKGPSKGDIGNYTKFSYSKLPKVYKWRAPFEEKRANFNEGQIQDLDDNTANYTYGEKEIWYINQIETKNSIAIFTLEDRKDGYAVQDKNGGIGDFTTKLLRKITLYSKPDYLANGASATPIKVVNFEYSYELCPGVPNNIGTSGPDDNTAKGKLTLKKVYFTYGNSLRGKFNPYTFEYNSGALNPAYGFKNNDRWGNYKPNSSPYYNHLFPYVEQNKTNADNYAQAWLLKAIVLPSGGKIEVTYESDDYAYVQDQKVMQMFRIQALVGSPNEDNLLSGANNMLMSNSPAIINKQFVIFKLQENIPISGTSPTDKQNDQKIYSDAYLKDIADLYFKINVNVTKNSFLSYYENVTGYCEMEDVTDINNAFMFSSGSTTHYTHGYLKVKNVDIGDGNGLGLNVHPMAKAAWQYGRMNLSKELYGRVDDNTMGLVKFVRTVTDATFIKPLIQALQGQNGYLMNKNCGKEIRTGYSYIRLKSPQGKKLGGGVRVKKISISDQWNTMIPGGTTTDESSYGQEYEYTTTNENGLVISSGVACNEPGVGGDESPLHQPIYFGEKHKKLLAPDDRFYLEGSVGESFLPGPSVGYSRVKVKNIGRTNVTRHATGYVINEFYTAKDFPAIVQQTPLESKRSMITPLLKILKKVTRNYMTATQGFSVELNDMHGKPKAVWVYAENSGMPISGTEYRYLCQPYQKDKYSEKGYRLTNSVQVMYPDGTVGSRELGVEYDVVNDFRKEVSASFGAQIGMNLDIVPGGGIPIPVISGFPSLGSDRSALSTAVMTKVINKYGLVQEVIAHDLGSKVGTKNLVYDSETGTVLLTQTKNEFEDDIYSFSYPAHWYYKGMGPAYKNYKLSFNDVDFNGSGQAVISNAGSWFVEGDEIISGNERGWVTTVNSSTNTITVVNELGNAFKPGVNDIPILIVRSGRRNILQANIGSIVAMRNPIDGFKNNSFSKVVNAGSQVFRDDWKTYCECFAGESSLMKISSNPYATGRKGIWRPFKGFTYLTNRELSIVNSNTNIREDGTFTNFSPYWSWNGSSWTENASGWTWTSEITEYSPFGMELENRDPLNRYSSATYGYNNSLPMSVAANAMYAEIGFDGFEDYDFTNCTNDHFSYKSNAGSLTNQSSHSGKSSMRVTSSSNVKVSKQIQNCTP